MSKGSLSCDGKQHAFGVNQERDQHYRPQAGRWQNCISARCPNRYLEPTEQIVELARKTHDPPDQTQEPRIKRTFGEQPALKVKTASPQISREALPTGSGRKISTSTRTSRTSTPRISTPKPLPDDPELEQAEGSALPRLRFSDPPATEEPQASDEVTGEVETFRTNTETTFQRQYPTPEGVKNEFAKLGETEERFKERTDDFIR